MCTLVLKKQKQKTTVLWLDIFLQETVLYSKYEYPTTKYQSMSNFFALLFKHNMYISIRILKACILMKTLPNKGQGEEGRQNRVPREIPWQAA